MSPNDNPALAPDSFTEMYGDEIVHVRLEERVTGVRFTPVAYKIPPKGGFFATGVNRGDGSETGRFPWRK